MQAPGVFIMMTDSDCLFLINFADYSLQRLRCFGVELPRRACYAKVQEYAFFADTEQLKVVVRINT